MSSMHSPNRDAEIVVMLAPRIEQMCRALASISEREGVPLYIVGGYVRDLLFGERADDRDLDFIVEGDARDFARIVAAEVRGDLQTFDAFFTAKVRLKGEGSELNEIDFASARSEIYLHPGALPRVSISSLTEDLRRRDFSVNAMALPLSALLVEPGRRMPHSQLQASLIDPFNGAADLETRSIRVLHEKSFIDDPTRIFRAARYVTRLSGSLEGATERWLLEAVQSGALGTVSSTRQLNEVRKILLEAEPLKCIALLESWGGVRALLGDRGGEARTATERLLSLPFRPEDPLEPILAYLISRESEEIQHTVVQRLSLGRRFLRRTQAAAHAMHEDVMPTDELTHWFRFLHSGDGAARDALIQGSANPR